MYITQLKADGFKNLSEIDIRPDKFCNIFCGRNAQGKTNILESIWILTGCKSFRGTSDKELIGLNCTSTTVEMTFENSVRKQKIDYSLNKKSNKIKKFSLNGIEENLNSRLFENFKCVIFTPDDLDFVKGGPKTRRSFLDLCISQIKPKYINIINRYDNILVQRNALLKKISQDSAHIEDLSVWDEQIAKLGSYISVMRYNYSKKLNIYCESLYEKISEGKEKFYGKYKSSIFGSIDLICELNDDAINHYLERLRANVRDDVKFGVTGLGIHRDDYLTKINNLYSREYASQGQQRSIALAMKLSQALIYRDEKKESPIILLDDVLSELDFKRQHYVMTLVDDMQVFITSCDPQSVLNHKVGKIFTVEDGRITSTKCFN